jgi:hypothetical protein
MSKQRSPARRTSPSAQPESPLTNDITPTEFNSIQTETDPERHTRKCQICHHPERDAIEDEYIRWVRPHSIVCKYDLNDRTSLYRHCRALGLDILRRRNLRVALEPILEAAECVRITADSVISAARIYSHINDDGQWEDPPRESIITKRPYYATSIPPALKERIQRATSEAASSNLQLPTSNSRNLIATVPKLESRITPTKQTTGTVSNRNKTRREKSTIRPQKRRLPAKSPQQMRSRA